MKRERLGGTIMCKENPFQESRFLGFGSFWFRNKAERTYIHTTKTKRKRTYIYMRMEMVVKLKRR
jgi:hypothetical protein